MQIILTKKGIQQNNARSVPELGKFVEKTPR
jgi:hypothetical protein